MLIGEKLLKKEENSSDAWNFGPFNDDSLTVEEIVNISKNEWSNINYVMKPLVGFHEAKSLKLDCTKAQSNLNWSPIWNTGEAVSKTISWYKNYYLNKELNSEDDLNAYIESAKNRKSSWID